MPTNQTCEACGEEALVGLDDHWLCIQHYSDALQGIRQAIDCLRGFGGDAA